MNGDLISRSAAKDEILSWAVVINKPHLLSKDDTLHVLDTLPAVDAVEVVRCKDCKDWDRKNIEVRQDTKGEYAECMFWSTWASCFMARSDNFCSQGERRADE